MADAARKTMSWLDVAVRNVGIRRGIRAVEWAYSWAVVREYYDGREPTVEEVATWWGQPRRTAFRDQADFRAAFPDLHSPSAIYDSDEARASIAKHARFGRRVEEWGEERRRRREAGSIEVAQLPAAN